MKVEYGKIEKQAKAILSNFPQIVEQPASLSGRFHLGESVAEHLRRTANIMKHLCDAMGVHGSDRDMLIACAYLHDLGIYVIVMKGKITYPTWEYHETGWSRIETLMKIHPIISSAILDEFTIDRKNDIKNIIITHMGHWYKNTPRPKNLYQYMLVMADFLANRKGNLFNYEESKR